jgi:hypothetical protein
VSLKVSLKVLRQVQRQVSLKAALNLAAFVQRHRRSLQSLRPQGSEMRR